MLLLRLGRAEDAGGKLGQIPEVFSNDNFFIFMVFFGIGRCLHLFCFFVFFYVQEFLVSWLENNLGFVVNVGTSKMTDLGKVRESLSLSLSHAHTHTRTHEYITDTK